MARQEPKEIPAFTDFDTIETVSNLAAIKHFKGRYMELSLLKEDRRTESLFLNPHHVIKTHFVTSS